MARTRITKEAEIKPDRRVLLRHDGRTQIIKRARKITGAISMPGDKSISHRAALISLLCREALIIRNFSDAEDCRRSLEAARALGAGINSEGNEVRITPPQAGVTATAGAIDCGNSATTMRLLAGILAGSGISARLVGDDSLMQRPMKRVVEPLSKMNAMVRCGENDTPPIEINPSSLVPLEYTLPIPSAQVKSALLLASLAGGCRVTLREPIPTRDHTERMLAELGVHLTVTIISPEITPDPVDPRRKVRSAFPAEYKRQIILDSTTQPSGGTIEVPGDISTAAFFIGAALMVHGSHLIITDVGLNPTRTGFINLLKQMGADITLKNRYELSGEARGDIEVRYSALKPRRLAGEQIAGLMDEVPILAVIASQIEGTTVIRNAEELRRKETDRISALAENLTLMGIKVGEFPDGLAIEGGTELNGAAVDSFGDHRIAMAMAVAGLAAHGETCIQNADVVGVSCPNFYTLLESVRQ